MCAKVQSFEEERVIKTSIDKAVNKDGSRIGNEGGTEVNNVI